MEVLALDAGMVEIVNEESVSPATASATPVVQRPSEKEPRTPVVRLPQDVETRRDANLLRDLTEMSQDEYSLLGAAVARALSHLGGVSERSQAISNTSMTPAPSSTGTDTGERRSGRAWRRSRSRTKHPLLHVFFARAKDASPR